MCGLVGEVRFDGRRVDTATVDRACEVLAPRGPDDSGLWVHGPVALGHRRLAIIDLSEAGSQPMVDPDLGLTVVFNGCIYNYEALRDELSGRGHSFFSHCDTEVITKAYAEWGIDCVQHFVGMFAFAIVERDSGRVVLGRDRLGVKPLYVDHTPDRLRFASTVPALLAAGGVDTSIDTVALSHYLSFNAIVPPPRTILSGVRKLPPATVRVVEPDGRSQDTRYWEPSFTRRADRARWSERDWAEALVEALRTSVRRRLVADVPVGVLLSGGIDSSLVVAMIAELGGPALSTYSIGFVAHGDVAGNEFAYSDLVAEAFDTRHHRIEVGSARLLDALDGAVSAMSEPMISPDCLAFYLLGQEVSTSLKVVQGGQGADETMAGYHWYPPLSGVPRTGAVDAYASVFADRSFEELAALLEPEWLLDRDEPRAFITEQFARPGAEETIDAALRIDTEVMLVDDPLKRLDSMMMASGVEARVPFLDHELVELVASVPPELKLAHGGKGILKTAARGLVPDEVIDRSKGYFRVPELRELAGPYLDRVEAALTDPAAKQRGLFRPAVVDALLADPRAHRTPIGSNALWQLGLLEMWLQAMDIR
jgi:asparagine synthase (glutamine-hydrolysing)